MSEEKTFLVINATANKDNMEDLKTYLGSITPVIGKNGAKPVGRYRATDQLVGDNGPEMVAVFEFPSSEAIKAMIESDDYKALSELRKKAFTKLNLTICGEM